MTATPARPAHPTATTVIRHLKRAGFQHSPYRESLTAPDHGGAQAHAVENHAVRVTWNESGADFEDRMRHLGITDPARMPEHPDTARRLADYADALTPRYAVAVTEGAVYVTARTAPLPARPPGMPTAATVRRALPAPRYARDLAVVDQYDHVRIAAADDDTRDMVTAALTAHGWTYTLGATAEHHLIKITGTVHTA